MAASASDILYSNPDAYNGYTGDMFYVDNDPMSFDKYWKYNYSSAGEGFGGWKDNPYSFGNKIYNLFTGGVSSAEKSYQAYIDDWNYHRDQQAAAYANYMTQKREDSAVQRAKQDYEAAGFSPYALIGANYAAPSSAMSYAKERRGDREPEQEKDDKLLSSALKVLALILLKKA